MFQMRRLNDYNQLINSELSYLIRDCNVCLTVLENI